MMSWQQRVELFTMLNELDKLLDELEARIEEECHRQENNDADAK